MPHTVLSALARARRVCFGGHGRDWKRHGTGEITPEYTDGATLLVCEQLRLSDGTRSRDRKRWCVRDDALLFQRERNGAFETIFTFRRNQDGQWHSPLYSCFPDTYFGRLYLCPRRVALAVRVNGMGKDDALLYVYPIA